MAVGLSSKISDCSPQAAKKHSWQNRTQNLTTGSKISLSFSFRKLDTKKERLSKKPLLLSCPSRPVGIIGHPCDTQEIPAKNCPRIT